VSALNEGRSPLLLTERVEHLERLAQLGASSWLPDDMLVKDSMIPG
jgi:hypothetical protein